MRTAALASIMAVAVTLSLASCGEERTEVETSAPDVEASVDDVAAAADLSGVHVEMHQAPG